MSIQEFLVQQGYVINELDETFSKWCSGWHRAKIPFSALIGHTLESFQRMAKQKGWIEEEEPTDYFDEPLAAAGAVYGIFLAPAPGSIIDKPCHPIFPPLTFDPHEFERRQREAIEASGQSSNDIMIVHASQPMLPRILDEYNDYLEKEMVKMVHTVSRSLLKDFG